MHLQNLFENLSIARLARDHPINYFDIGSRGGFQGDMAPLAFAVNAVGFEPEPAEFEGLDADMRGPWLSARHLPFAISGHGGRQALYIPRDPQSASLMKHDQSIGIRFDKRQFFDLEQRIDVDTRTLSDAVNEADVGSVDYLKIDIEGPELDVIGSSPALLQTMLAVKTEVSFVPFRHDQPLAWKVDQFMLDNGFVLMDLIGPAHWRRNGYVIHPHCAEGTPSYSKGQLMQGDYLYFRDPETLGDDPAALVKLALISMAHGYFDNAQMVLETAVAQDYIGEKFGLSVLEAVGPASKKYGRKIFWATLYTQFRSLVPILRYSKNAW